MAIQFKKTSAVFTGVAGPEEAETLLEWLQQHPRAKINLKGASHLHPANLQVLMAAGCKNYLPPADPALAAWIATALQTDKG